MKPFVTWAGGKKQLLPKILPLIPEITGTYHEPFVGGGAVFFALKKAGRIQKAILSDLNVKLMNTYWFVQRELEPLMDYLATFTDTEEEYLKYRALFNDGGWEDDKEPYLRQAALFIYLNKTCFNGLYRENSRGKLNSPYGHKATRGKAANILDKETLYEAHVALEDAIVMYGGYERLRFTVNSGDFVYFDPPYAPVSETSFTKYTKEGFGPKEQGELAEMCKYLNDGGVKFLLSNSDAPMIHELYKDFKIEVVTANRVINSKGSGRGKVNEVLIRNY